MIDLTLCMLGNFTAFLVVCRFFVKIYVFKKFFQECCKHVKQCDLDKVRHFVGLDLGPNCLQRQTADEKSRH